MIALRQAVVLVLFTCGSIAQAKHHFNIYVQRFVGERCPAGDQIGDKLTIKDGTYPQEGQDWQIDTCGINLSFVAIRPTRDKFLMAKHAWSHAASLNRQTDRG